MPLNLANDYERFVGRLVRKEKKPFKSGSKTNTVTGVVDHPIMHVPAFTFAEDDSVVECHRCALVNPPALMEEDPLVQQITGIAAITNDAKRYHAALLFLDDELKDRLDIFSASIIHAALNPKQFRR